MRHTLTIAAFAVILAAGCADTTQPTTITTIAPATTARGAGGTAATAPATTAQPATKWLASLKRQVLTLYQGTSREGVFDDATFTGDHQRVTIHTSLYPKASNKDAARGLAVNTLTSVTDPPERVIVQARDGSILIAQTRDDLTP